MEIQKISYLLSQMTLPEKIGQMTQIERVVTTPAVIAEYFIGINWPFEDAKPSDWADMIDGYQNAALASCLGIPIIYGIDAVHGNNNVYGATIFPHNIGLGATGNADLIRRIGVATELEVRAIGASWTFAPCVAGSHPRNTLMVTLFLQDGINNVVACAKHFVGDGGTDKDINEGNTIVSYEELERIHLAPYLKCLAQGVSTVMASYSSWNGSKLHSDYFLLTEVLKQKLGFKVMVPFKYKRFIEDLKSLVESGEEHRELGREAVRKSLVLLKNGKNVDKPFLPLDRNAKRILITGTHVDDLGYQCGGWTNAWFGLSGRISIGTTLLDAIKAIVGDKTEVIYEKTPSEETLASSEGFSYAIVAVGEAPYAETRGDNSELKITFNGSDIVTLVAEKIPTLVILFSGRPMALVAAWLPGSEGQGMADIIFGDYDFEGMLPVSWLKRVEQLPLNADADLYDPLFPLGFGLKLNSGGNSCPI
ncbi:hypothetical protein Bca52824_000955 [Brassica carinata]|uniref:Glycoside hydrolase family 3 C-terminal domain-containing protein n=1 Tax=Brassica carinata TaxID=52824 RepID=A0A8X7WJ37_BRACI|nr:hypothetical protein Bca52824_000955 [Brassica carinata]